MEGLTRFFGGGIKGKVVREVKKEFVSGGNFTIGLDYDIRLRESK